MKNYARLAQEFFKNSLRNSKSFVPEELFIQHTELVLKYSLKIASGRSINKEALEAGCWLHDAGRFIDDENHRAAGVKIAEQFFQENSIADEKFRKIAVDCIQHHGIRDKPETIEGRIVKEADRLALIDFGYLKAAARVYKVSLAEAAQTFYEKANLPRYYKLEPELAERKLNILRRRFNLR